MPLTCVFAFAFHCFHQKLLSNLKHESLLESVLVEGNGILAVDDPEVITDVGAPPFMDDVVIPISDPCPH